jgi:hypothetical protein
MNNKNIFSKIYKVVHQDSLTSACMENSKFQVIYKIGKFIKPKVKKSKLYAFSDLWGAFDFAENTARKNDELVVYDAIGKNVGIPTLLGYIFWETARLKRLWERLDLGLPINPGDRFTFEHSSFGGESWLKSAVWCDEIMLMDPVTYSFYEK